MATLLRFRVIQGEIPSPPPLGYARNVFAPLSKSFYR